MKRTWSVVTTSALVGKLDLTIGRNMNCTHRLSAQQANKPQQIKSIDSHKLTLYCKLPIHPRNPKSRNGIGLCLDGRERWKLSHTMILFQTMKTFLYMIFDAFPVMALLWFDGLPCSIAVTQSWLHYNFEPRTSLPLILPLS